MPITSNPLSNKLRTWLMRKTIPQSVRRVATLNAALASDVGLARTDNQDRVVLVRCSNIGGQSFLLAAIADGIGGMKQGADCAALTLAAFIDTVIQESQRTSAAEQWLKCASRTANKVVHAQHGGLGGSTLAAILFARDCHPVWLSVGDSRVYQTADAKMTQLSRDDTLEGQLGKQYDGTRRSELLQFIGIGDEIEPHVQQFPPDIQGTLLLTTDGVHFIHPEYLSKIAHHSHELGITARRYLDLARMLGGPDNASIVALDVNSPYTALDSELGAEIEIWDPFGELNIIFDSAQRTPSPTTPPESSRNPIPLSAKVSSTPASVEGKESSSGADKAASDRRSKGKSRSARKGKGKGRNDGAPDGDESPQLSVEFGNKRP